MKPTALLGTVVDGRYRIEEIAGQGGYGVVYRALHLSFDVPVAVKVLKMREDPDGPVRESLIAAFRREGRLLSRLSSLHSSFVQAKEAGTLLAQDGTPIPYLVLEWLDGVSLAEELRRRRAAHAPPFTLEEVIRLLAWPAEALALAHDRGISHRDIKPGNLLLTEREGRVATRVVDLGLAKVLEDTLSTSAPAETQSGMRPCTPAYGAPEQWLTRLGASGPWTDVHAWALLCVELLAGVPALQGANSVELMGACLDTVRPTPRALGVAVSAEVEAIFARALALRTDDRYRDMRSFWQDLGLAAGTVAGALPSSILIGTPRSAIPDTGRVVEIETAAPTASMAEGVTPSSKRPRAGRGRLHFLAASTLVAIGVLAALLTLRARQSSAPLPVLPATSPAGLPPQIMPVPPTLGVAPALSSAATSLQASRPQRIRRMPPTPPMPPAAASATASADPAPDPNTESVDSPGVGLDHNLKDLVKHHELSSRR